MRCYLPIFASFLLFQWRITLAVTPSDITTDNAKAIVFLQVVDQFGREVAAGTGFIVSHDGYVLTADHVQPMDKTYRLVATIGQRNGTVFPLEYRDSDKSHDVALWQLPQSSDCKQAVIIETDPIDDSQHFIALGYPGSTGLSRAQLNITNTHSTLGFFKSDGQLEGGYSGGPVFNEEGRVVGFVQGGTISGARSNDIVPIASAIALITKNGVAAALGSVKPFPLSCYSKCRAPEHGLERWTVETPWTDQTNKLNGGSGEAAACIGLIAAALVGKPTGTRIDLAPGENDPKGGMWEEVVDQPFTKYIYHCRGTLRSGPVYKEARTRACPLWN